MHGMTLGELARLLVAERGLATPVEIVPLSGWHRAMRFEDTGLPWFPPSPNLRTPRAALLYPGVALLEMTNLSVGRGTATPFELVGAPWLDPPALIRSVGRVEGADLEPADFTPEAGPYRGERCRGVRVVLRSPALFSPLALGFSLVRALARVHGADWDARGVDVLLRSEATLGALTAGASPALVEARLATDVEQFGTRRRLHLLYE
jgi:uncharacterized protein YbbC (DUF1343 family)